jgi:5-methylthioadenosine/S-adenosylhomocysteine deaminase
MAERFPTLHLTNQQASSPRPSGRSAGDDGALGGLVKGILVPREVETSSLEMLERTREPGDRYDLPMATHAAYSVLEFRDIVREHLETPVELLDRLGLSRTTLDIGHGNLIADNPNLNYSGGADLKLMGRHRASISHCPINIVRRARSLDNWRRYREAGVDITIGSDTYPREMVMNMRTASYLGKLIGHSYFDASAGEVFEAATTAGARSLGRDDLGRLGQGALADIVVIRLAQDDGLRFGPVRDPIRSLVECGIGDDVRTVIVDGVVRMRDGVIPGMDLGALGREAQAAGEAIWDGLASWDPLGRTAEQAQPWSFPLLAEDEDAGGA